MIHQWMDWVVSKYVQTTPQLSGSPAMPALSNSTATEFASQGISCSLEIWGRKLNNKGEISWGDNGYI
jgi:hypothetical protein